MNIEWVTWRHLARGCLRQIWRYRLRSALVIFCAALGVAGAVTSVNYASGGRAQVLEKIRRLGTNVRAQFTALDTLVSQLQSTGNFLTPQLALQINNDNQ